MVCLLGIVGLAGLMLMSGAAWQIYSWRAKVHYKLLSSAPLELPNPSGLAVTKDGVWLADWNRGLSLKDAKDLATLRVLPVPAGETLRPGALTASSVPPLYRTASTVCPRRNAARWRVTAESSA